MADARAVVVQRAQIFDQSKNNNFCNFCYPWVRKQIFQSISRCQTVRYGLDVVATSRTMAQKSNKNPRKQPILQFKVCLDEPRDNGSGENYSNSIIDVLKWSNPEIYSDTYPDHISSFLGAKERRLMVLLHMNFKERKEMGQNNWEDEVIELAPVVCSFKSRGLILRTDTRRKMIYELMMKIWRGYTSLGFKIPRPVLYKYQNIKKI